MIVAYTGKLGSGKTYTMTKDIVKELNKGVKVYSNYKIHWYGFEEQRRWYKSLFIFLRLRGDYKYYPASNLSYWSEVDDILNLHEGIVAIDEGSVYLNSRNWSLLDPEFQRKILQSRKDGLHILFTAQRIGQIDITLRNLVNLFYVSTFKSMLGFKFFVLGIYEIDNNGDINEEDRLGIRVVRLNKKQTLYDTNEKISSIISTMANFATQIKNLKYKQSMIRKYEPEINERLREQGFDITVAEVLKLEQDLGGDPAARVPVKPRITKKKVAVKAINNSVDKPVEKPVVNRRLVVKPA